LNLSDAGPPEAGGEKPKAESGKRKGAKEEPKAEGEAMISFEKIAEAARKLGADSDAAEVRALAEMVGNLADLVKSELLTTKSIAADAASSARRAEDGPRFS
jgi:hypothetical protein